MPSKSIPVLAGKRRQPQKANQTSWQPGQSGNPKGRPKNRNLLSRALRDMLGMVVPDDSQGRTYAEIIALSLILAAAKGSVGAACEIADRTEGKPRQAVDLAINQTEYDRYKKMVDNLIDQAAARGIELSEGEAIERLGEVDEHIHEVFAVAAISGV